MSLINAAVKILRQLSDMVDQINPADFAKPSTILGGATVGQHVRHTLDFFICLETGYKDGIINYDTRLRDKAIESEKMVALDAIAKTIAFIFGFEQAKNLRLQVKYDFLREEYIEVDTNSLRELLYNVEHAVHHMAIIKIGIAEIAPYVVLGDDFGIAASTVRHARLQLVARNLNGDFPA